MGPKAEPAHPSNTKSSLSTPPKTILLIGSSAPGTMRAAAGGSAVPSRSRPARDGEGVGCPACSRGSRGARQGARGWVRNGRGRPGLRGGHRPSCGWSASRAEAQRRSPLRPLSGPGARRRPPPLAPPSPAAVLSSSSGSRLLLSLPPPALALSPLTFPSPGGRRRAAGGFAAHCRPRAASGCALYLVPAPPARSGDHTKMPGAGDRGAARARWLGTGLLGKAAPA